TDGTSSTTELVWEAANGPHLKLRAVPVFDSATALELGDTATTATHLPRAMRFVGMLIHISDAVANRLKIRAARLTTRLPLVPAEHVGSDAVTLIKRLTAKLSEDDINTACAFPPALDEERLALETALGKANPEVAHAKAIGELDRL